MPPASFSGGRMHRTLRITTGFLWSNSNKVDEIVQVKFVSTFYMLYHPTTPKKFLYYFPIVIVESCLNSSRSGWKDFGSWTFANVRIWDWAHIICVSIFKTIFKRLHALLLKHIHTIGQLKMTWIISSRPTTQCTICFPYCKKFLCKLSTYSDVFSNSLIHVHHFSCRCTHICVDGCVHFCMHFQMHFQMHCCM